MAFSPVIARLYGPEEFGLLGTFAALLTVLNPIAALCYPIAIVLPKHDSDAKGIIRLCIYISLAMAAALMLILLLGGKTLLALVGASAIAAFALLIPLNMVFSAWIQVGSQWLIRKRQFQATAKVNVIQALATNSAKAGIGWHYPYAATLILMTTIGSAFHAFLLYLGARKTADTNSRPYPKGPETPVSELARRHYDFPFYRAPQVFINAVSQSLPVLMLAAFFGPAAAGFYTICRRVLGLPSQLIGLSVGDVFYPHITEAAHKGQNITRLLLRATLGLAAVGFFPFAAIIAFGPWLFGLVFGADWTVAGQYARWLSLMLFFNFINRPSVVTIPVLNLQRGLMIYELFSTGSKLAALYIGFMIFADDVLTVALYSLFGAAAYFILISWVIYASQRENGHHRTFKNA